MRNIEAFQIFCISFGLITKFSPKTKFSPISQFNVTPPFEPYFLGIAPPDKWTTDNFRICTYHLNFPCNGNFSGGWVEQDPLMLVPAARLKVKIIGLHCCVNHMKNFNNIQIKCDPNLSCFSEVSGSTSFSKT